MTSPPVAARTRHSAALRWMHWVNFPLLFVMIWSGLRIYWAEDAYSFGILGWEWFHFFPDAWFDRLDLDHHLARGLAFHLTFAWLFVLNGLAYAVYLTVGRQWRHLVPDRQALRNVVPHVLADLGLRAEAPEEEGYNGAQKLTYTIVFAMGAVMVVSGFAIYKPTQLGLLTSLFGGYGNARLVHFATTMAFLGFFVVHVLQVARAGWRNFAAMVTGYELVPERSMDEDGTEGAPS